MTTLESKTVTLGACPHDCPDTCSMTVTVDGGRVTKVRGNPDHPFTQGGLCVKVTDFPNHIYAPDRILSPLRRVGAAPKGEGGRGGCGGGRFGAGPGCAGGVAGGGVGWRPPRTTAAAGWRRR